MERYRILFLASWYPNKYNPVSGIFIKRQVEAVSKFCDVAVLFTMPDPNLKKDYEIDYTEDDHFKNIL